MEFYGIYLPVFAIIVLTTFVSPRAVNISNTWMLPEEGFPVFYRYFRDRISWYEADAVCQFHHANLVTADSTSQYDAIRAYLKELDITENIWIGLSKTTERPNFTWTNFHPLNGDGHWQQPIPKGNEAICVAMDPVADFLWKPMSCGGPDVASFICELPVPSWAMGAKGCLLTELPSLTVLYIPEQLALELTSDCGFGGTKRITCKGNANREEILKHLTCAISPEDFEDKSTKSPISSNTISNSVSDMSSEDILLNGKTTKPWIWTSNTIDIDYGMPTRHRRETEDTLSPGSTKSTTDLSTSESQIKSKLMSTSSNVKYDPETTSFAPEEDVTLDLIVSLKSDKSTELKVTESIYSTQLTTQRNIESSRSREETLGDAFGTTDPKDLEVEDAGEYPSAIGQGQLFSIIENGTMFDIVEMNETTPDDSRLTKSVMETSQTEPDILKASTDHSSDDSLYTTVVYHKEPPSDTSFVTNKSVKKTISKKHTFKEKDPKKQNQQGTDKSFHDKTNMNTLENKEIAMFALETDPLMKLNRTNRKQLPLHEKEMSAELKNSNISKNLSHNDNELEPEKHQHVEVKWHDEGNTNLLPMKLYVTTKRSDSTKKVVSPTNENIELMNSTEDESETLHKIDSKLDFLNKNNNATINNNTETFVVPKPEKIEFDESVLMKEEFLPKSLVGETESKVSDNTSMSISPTEPLEPEPQAQPRPNRQRQLTRPQRRSFYPYFFSRVLG